MRTLSLRLSLVAVAGALAGCGGGNPINAILGNQIGAALNSASTSVVVVRIINQTGQTMEVDLLVDGLAQTVSCTSVLQVCDSVLPTCPQRIETVRDRKVDLQGRFLGGHEFNGNEAFIFERGEFQCGQHLIYQYDDRGNVEAYVL